MPISHWVNHAFVRILHISKNAKNPLSQDNPSISLLCDDPQGWHITYLFQHLPYFAICHYAQARCFKMMWWRDTVHIPNDANWTDPAVPDPAMVLAAQDDDVVLLLGLDEGRPAGQQLPLGLMEFVEVTEEGDSIKLRVKRKKPA